MKTKLCRKRIEILEEAKRNLTEELRLYQNKNTADALAELTEAFDRCILAEYTDLLGHQVDDIHAMLSVDSLQEEAGWKATLQALLESIRQLANPFKKQR